MTPELHQTLTEWLEHGTPSQRSHAARRLKAMRDSGEAITQPVRSPSVPAMAFSALKAAGQFVASGFALASHEEIQRRLDICQKCEHYEAGRCKLCGCLSNLKVRAAAMKCPDKPPRW